MEYPRLGATRLTTAPSTYDEFLAGIDLWANTIAPPGAYRTSNWVTFVQEIERAPGAGGLATIRADGQATITIQQSQCDAIVELLNGRVLRGAATPRAIFIHLHEVLHATFERRTPDQSRLVAGAAAACLDEGGIDFVCVRAFPDFVHFLRLQDRAQEDLVRIFERNIDACIRRVFMDGFEYILNAIHPRRRSEWLSTSWRWLFRDFADEVRLDAIAQELVWALGGEFRLLPEARKQAVSIEVEHYFADVPRYYRESSGVRNTRLHARIRALRRVVEEIHDEVVPRGVRRMRALRKFHRSFSAPDVRARTGFT